MLLKEKYIVFCEKEKDIPVFSQPWWLDAVCGETQWDVILIEKGEEIIASFVYYITQGRFNLKYVGMPVLTQKLGPYIRYPKDQKLASRLSYEKDVMQEIIKKLPPFDFFSVCFDYKYTNWLPFYWKGFYQTTRYTYVIDDISDIEIVFNNFEHSKRKNVKKANKEVQVLFDLSADDFYNNHKMTLQKQGAVISYSYDIFKKLYDGAYKNNQGRVIYSKDVDGNIHAALFVVWDDYSAYDLISTIDPAYRNSGAATLMIFEVIKYLADKVKVFDFEGSMIDGVEESFRKFGTVQKPYFCVYKANSRKYKLMHAIKDIVNATKN